MVFEPLATGSSGGGNHIFRTRRHLCMQASYHNLGHSRTRVRREVYVLVKQSVSSPQSLEGKVQRFSTANLAEKRTCPAHRPTVR